MGKTYKFNKDSEAAVYFKNKHHRKNSRNRDDDSSMENEFEAVREWREGKKG